MQDGHDGLSSWRMICKAASCDKQLCMIDADKEAVGHVSGSHQIRRVLHDVITFTVIGQRLLESCTLCSDSETSVENWQLLCIELLKSVSSFGRGATVNSSTSEKRTTDARSVAARDLVRAKGAAV